MAKIDRAREKQALEQERRILQIKKIIASFPDDSKPFKTVSAAAKYVAKRLSEIEGTNVASTTILRNVHYRALINQKFGFAESEPGDKAETPHSRCDAPPIPAHCHRSFHPSSRPGRTWLHPQTRD